MLPLNGANINKFSIMRRCLYIIIGFALCLSACSQSEAEQLLCDVETYIMERPDSALKVLEGMDRSVLESEKERAHYCLLLSMALDKNWIDVASDSLTRIAVSYYGDHEPRQNYARALYYNGLTYFYQEDYENAIIEFTKAEDVAVVCDSLYLGMIKVVQADTYARTYNEVEELRCLREAVSIFENISADSYYDASILRLAQAYSTATNFVDAESMFISLLQKSHIDSLIRRDALREMAYLYMALPTPDYNSALERYQELEAIYSFDSMSYQDYWAYAYALSLSGNHQEADDIVSDLLEEDTLSHVSNYWQYRMSRSVGNYYDACNYLEITVNENSRIVDETLKQSLASAQRDYFNGQLINAELEVQAKRNQTRFLILLTVCMVLVVCVVLRHYILRERNKRRRLLGYIEEIKRNFTISNRGSVQDVTLKEKFITLYRSRFEVLNTLCLQFLETEGRKDAEKIIYTQVWSLVEDIKNDTIRRAKFEVILDQELDNIMTNLRNEMPKLKEVDFSMFAYLVAGFDLTTISRLLDMSLNNVYAHKRRLRLKIQDKQPLHAQHFLEMIS